MKKSELRQIIKEEIKQVLQESTRSRVGIMGNDGRIKSVYVHYNGYVDGVGKMLKQNYKDAKKIKELVDLGDLSYIAKEVGKQHDFGKPTKGWTVAYGRDRGEKNIKPEISKDESGFLSLTSKTGGEFSYYWNPKLKKWFYSKGKDSFKEL